MRKVITPDGRELCGVTFPESMGMLFCTSEFDHDGDHYCVFTELHDLIESGYTVVDEPEFDCIVPLSEVDE